MSRYTDFISTAERVPLDGSVYYVTPAGGVFVELGAREGAPYLRRCTARKAARVRAVLSERAQGVCSRSAGGEAA